MSTQGIRACALHALAIVSCACVSTEQREHYAALRDRLVAAPPAASAAALDPLEHSPELSRSALVELVLARNPGIDAARAAARAALARWPQESALPDPMFGYGLRPQSLASSEVHPGNDFELSQGLPFPGKLELRGERALSEADAAESGLALERVRLASVTSIAFDEYWLSERARETNAHQRALLAQAREVALSRYAAGTGEQQDALAAETEQAMLEHRAIELDVERSVAVERINVLLDRPPQLELPPPPLDLEPPAEESNLDVATLVARALERRPELRALQAEVRARESEVAIARRDFLPDVTVRAGYDSTWQEVPLRPLVGFELNLPLQLERRRAALEEADAQLAREKSRLRRLENEVSLQVTVALQRLHESRHLLELSESRLVPVARARESSARAAFSAGRIAFIELTEAERALTSADQSVFEARAAFSRRVAELAKAVGNLAGAPDTEP